MSLEVTENVIPGNLFPATYNSKPISAALEYDEQSFLVFKGNVYLTVHKSTFQPLGNIQNWTGWPGFWKNDIDAALKWPDGSFVFIKGLQYVSYNPRNGQTSRPAQLNQWAGWPSSWSGSIDAAFNGQDGYLYFIRKGEILAMDANTLAFAPGYPRKLAGEISGVNMAGTNNWSQPKQNQQNLGSSEAPDISNWCAVGTPDPGTSPDGGNIYPMKTDMKGGPGGEEFMDKLVRGTRVKEVRVWAMNMIQAIEIVTESQEGFITEGGAKGFKMGSPKTFELAPGECIIGIEGTYGGSSGDYIYTLKFLTNKRKSPEFGGMGGRKGDTSFLFEVPPEGSFSGFHGRSSRFLDAIGIQYNIYQHVAWGADGELIETVGDKSAWNSAKVVSQDELDELAAQDDEYFDDHVDVSQDETLADMFMYTIMPNFSWIGKAVDLAKIDPWDVTSSELPSGSVLLMIPAKIYGGPENRWFFPYGTNRNQSVSITTGRSSEEIHMLQSFAAYSNEFGVKVGAEFDAAGTAAGSLNLSHRERNTNSIGSKSVMISKTVSRESHSVTFDLVWDDDRTGVKNRQRLAFGFRKAIEELPIPKGKIPNMSTSSLRKGGQLPINVQNVKKEYMDVVNKYGTHYLNDIIFGGYFTMYSMLTETQISQSKMTQNAVSASFSAGVKGITAGGSVDVDNTNTSETSQTEMNFKIDIMATGGGGNTEFSQWSSEVTKEPRPRDFSLNPHTDFLTPVFFPNDPDIEKKQAALDLVIRQYLVDNDIGLGHDAHKVLNFMTEEQLQGQPIKIKVEILRMKTSMVDGGGEGDNIEFKGHAIFAVIGPNDQFKGSGDVYGPDAKMNLKPNSFVNVSKSFQVTTTKEGLKDLKLHLYGWASDEDDWSGDDEIFNQTGLHDGYVGGLDGLLEPGSSITPTITLGQMVFEAKVTWIK